MINFRFSGWLAATLLVISAGLAWLAIAGSGGDAPAAGEERSEARVSRAMRPAPDPVGILRKAPRKLSGTDEGELARDRISEAIARHGGESVTEEALASHPADPAARQDEVAVTVEMWSQIDPAGVERYLSRPPEPPAAQEFARDPELWETVLAGYLAGAADPGSEALGWVADRLEETMERSPEETGGMDESEPTELRRQFAGDPGRPGEPGFLAERVAVDPWSLSE